MIRQTGLDFANGTTDECKRLVSRLVSPQDLFSAYRFARQKFNTSDLILTISEQDPSGFEAEPRAAYVKRALDTAQQMPILKNQRRLPAIMRPLAAQSAHQVAQLPRESDAMWLVVVRGLQAVPVMCVVYAIQYQAEAAN